MRKRSGRPLRFAAVPNETIDDARNLDFMALALLTVLIRHRDGWWITLEEIGAKYGYGREALANAMGLLQVARYVVKVRMMSTNGNHWSTEVYVYDTPATDQEIEALLAEVQRSPAVREATVIKPTATALAVLKRHRAKLAKKQRQGPSVAVPRVPENPHSGATCDDDEKPQVGPECRVSRQSGDPAVIKKTVVGEDEREDEEAVSPRSGGDGRRPSDGSSVSARESGSAASSNNQPSPDQHDDRQQKAPDKPKHTREELATVAAVRAFLPPELAGTGVPALTTAVLAALADGTPEVRTVEQLGARIQRRWDTHGWAMRVLKGERLERPVGVAIDLVRPYRRGDRYGCPNPRCEDGIVLDTGDGCTTCAERMAQRAEEHRQGKPQPMPAPRAEAVEWWECAGCGHPAKGAGWAGRLCVSCATAAVEIPVDLEPEWEPSAANLEAAWSALLDEAYADQAQRCRAEVEEQQRLQAVEQRKLDEAAEMARLREEIARQYPELAAVSSRPAPF